MAEDRTNLVVVPNIDLLFDPAYAKAEARRIFGEHLDVVAELREYGLALLKRLLKTSVKDSLVDLVMVGGLLRQTILAIDAWHLCASDGAAQASLPHLRSCLEAFLSTEWILQKGKEPWARRLFIGSVRDARRAARRLLAGTEEHRLFQEAWQQSFGTPHVASPEGVQAATDQDRSALDALEHRANEPVYREFEAFVAEHGREPEWYELGTDGVSSIFALASALDRRAEYYALYENYSDASHGTRMDLHFRKNVDGLVLLEPIRNAAALRGHAGLAVSMPIRMYRALLEHYRPAELEQFAAQYLERWRAKMVDPKVTVEVQPVPF